MKRSRNPTHLPHSCDPTIAMGRIEDLTHQVFGRLTVIGYAGRHRTYPSISFWHCLCVCGQKTTVQRENLKSGNSQACSRYCRDKYKNKFPVKDYPTRSN